VTFTDTSSNATNWTWTFGDGNTSIAKSPTFTYNVLGTYSVNHSANNTHDVSWTNRSSYITVTNASALLAQYNPWKTVSIWYPSGIYYNDTSLGTPISWNWTFGDGTNSTKQNPYKQWRAPGVYHVRLTVSNSYTTSSNSSWVQVMKWT
jgi:PKD repeat protein